MAILKIEHLGIAVKNAADSKSVFEKLLGAEAYKEEAVESEGAEGGGEGGGGGG